MVFILSHTGKPLMPTERYGRVRHLLKDGKAKVINRTPFTIRLLYDTEERTQPVSLGVDAGSEHIGLSATTDKKELFAAQVDERGQEIVKNLSVRRAARRGRRNRKTRYRQARFNNRVHSKHKGWLAPSVEAKVQTHLTAVQKVQKILPITCITVETASFDMQKIQAIKAGSPIPQGTDYQNGPQKEFNNVREYVLWRDDHVCQCCYGKSHDKVLCVHHIESRQTGGSAPNNLITLCETCHKGYHAGRIKLSKTIHRGMSFRHAAFMGIMRWAFYDRLKAENPDIPVRMTYGYITKYVRITNNLEKSHIVDARCISGNPSALPTDQAYLIRKVRSHNRQLYKQKILPGGQKKLNQAPRTVHGLRLFDTVRYNHTSYIVFSRRQSGYMDIRLLDGTKVHNGSLPVRKIQLIHHNNTWLTEAMAV